MPATGQPLNPAANIANVMTQSGLASLLATGLNQQLALASEQLLQLLKNLLQMPKELGQLMAMLADVDPASAQALLQNLLQSETPVPLEQLQQLLLSHADAAQDKLMKLLQSTAQNPGNQSSQMGELLSTLNELVAKAKESPMQALQSTISLYLPAYPFHPPQAFSLRYEPPGTGDNDGENSDENQQGEQLSLFMDTMTLGQFKITLAAQGPAPIQAVVLHDPVAKPFEAEITQQVNEALGGAGRMELLFMPKPGQTAKPETSAASSEPAFNPSETSAPYATDGKQSVALHPSGGISMAALYGAYAIIRVIFELDEQNKTHQARAAMI